MSSKLSRDSMAMLLLCSNIASPHAGKAVARPLSIREWDLLASKIADSTLKTPAALMTGNPGDWREELGLSENQAERLRALLSLGGNLGIALERLENIGIWVTTRIEDGYPGRLKSLLKDRAPIYLFGAGDAGILESEGIAIVGSRDVDEEGAKFADLLARKCASEGITVISGGARGVDQTAQKAAHEAGGKVICVLPHGLEPAIRKRETREALLSGRLCMLSATHPKASFNVGSAMERNKYIYALSRFAVVVSSSYKKGGTWEGAIENLRNGWVPLLVRSGETVPEGNRRLIEEGAYPMDTEKFMPDFVLRSWLADSTFSPTDIEGKKNVSEQQTFLFEI